MNTQWIKILVSACIVYTLVAACGAGSSDSGTVAAQAGSGGVAGAEAGSGGVAGSDGSTGLVDALVDALIDPVVDPVSEAKAEPLPDLVVTANCVYNPCEPAICSNNSLYAKAEFPGKTAQQLAKAHIVAHRAVDPPNMPGYVYTIPDVYLKDGSMIVKCGYFGNNNVPQIEFDTVTFIVPQ